MSKLSVIDASANCLNNFSIELPLGELVSVTGLSGSGKTTLLRDLLNGEWRRRANGDLQVKPQLIHSLPPVFYFGSQRPPRSKDRILEGVGAAPFLQELALRLGQSRCIRCNELVRYESIEQLYARLLSMPGATVVVGVPFTAAQLTNVESERTLRVIKDSKVVKFETLKEGEIGLDLVKALDIITISSSTKGRLLELLKLGKELSNEKITLLVNNKLEQIYFIPTCLNCNNTQKAFTRDLLAEGDSKEFLSISFKNGNSVACLLNLPLEDLERELGLFKEANRVESEILLSLLKLVRCANQLGLGYLSLSRNLRSLSSGEYQRVKLAAVLVEQVYGSLIALDEPSSGLSPTDTDRLTDILLGISKRGNSVIVATHNKILIERSAEVVEFEKSSSFTEISYQGSAERYLSSKLESPVVKPKKFVSTKFLKFTDINLHNLINLKCEIPIQAMTCIYGISGSGKSTLALDVILPLVAKLIRQNTESSNLEIGKLEAYNHGLGRVVSFRAARYFSLQRSGVASALGLVPFLREIYLKTEIARVRGAKFRDLNFYNPSILASELRFKGIAFTELRSLSIGEAYKLFENIPSIHSRLSSAIELGISYLKLGQPLRELSAGEEQRIRLAAKIATLKNKSTIFILDEPLNGIAPTEQIQVLNYLRKLIEKGHTVIAVDHSPIIFDFCDSRIELGPGAGRNGGKVMSVEQSA